MKPNKKRHCYEALRQKVLTLDLAPGMILDETMLATEHGLSRTPLREVLQQLAGEGYLSLEANRGASVSSMDLTVMRNFFQTAPMIYAAVTRLAAENGKQTQIGDLKQAQARFIKAVAASDAAETALCNHRFHEIIGEMAGNPYLTPSLKRLLIDHTRMSQTFYTAHSTSDRERIETASRQHDEIIEAIETRAPARAVELTLDHWALSRSEIEKYVYPDPLPVEIDQTQTGKLRNAV
jgi:DNA-binding GntR family transcriptional regulator